MNIFFSKIAPPPPSWPSQPSYCPEVTMSCALAFPARGNVGWGCFEVTRVGKLTEHFVQKD
jgi:hypothetical protein